MFYNQIVLPAISNHQDLERFLKLPLTYGILMNFQLAQLEYLIKTLKQNGKKILVHSELIKGLSSDEFGAIYLIQSLKVDGIISSKPKVIEVAMKRKVIGILRIFLKDSISLKQSLEITESVKPKYLEILPATCCIEILDEIRKTISCDILTGGLIRSTGQIQECIEAGAIAVTTSNPDFWDFGK